ncbi:MAG: hypothetical protein DID92_2727744108 [Candidatus Nitrotoga sp. SPKER]|nr:MAG: hypothetical protein DID92_2727744108 [Candidatus Nitrotoga sp. SPKER]
MSEKNSTDSDLNNMLGELRVSLLGSHLLFIFSSIVVALPAIAITNDPHGTVTLNTAGQQDEGSEKTFQQKKQNAVAYKSIKKSGKTSNKKRQPVLTKRNNFDGTITYKTAGKPDADLSETISLKQSKEIDKQAKAVGVQVIEIMHQPIMTKKANSDGTVTYNSVNDLNADFSETVTHKQSKDIEKQATDSGVKVVEINDQSVMSKKLNSDGTVTYKPVGEPKIDTSETIPIKDGKEVDQKFKEQGVKIIDVTPQ